MSLPPYLRKTATSVFLASIAISLTPVVAHAAPESKDPFLKTPVSALSASLPEGEQRYIVKYENGTNAEAESQSLKQQGIEVKETLSHAMKASVVVANPKEIESLKNSEEVASVELDTPVSVSGATSIWGVDRIDQRTGRDGQFSVGDEGAGVNVYVVDTGLNMGHTDFAGRIPTSYWGIHDGLAAGDCSGHGTHVAGSAVGTTYGVAKKASVIPVRVLDCAGNGWSSTVMAGIDWAIGHHQAGQPAVMNLSIGGFTNWSFDQTVQSAINDGITVIAAAGNDGLDSCNSSPSRVPNAITVAATDINDNQVSWSNYGSCVDIQAPGVSIRSAWINAPTGYNTMSGTSMAAPHVSGAAAVMLSRDRSMTPAQVSQNMLNNSTPNVVGANKGATPNRFLFLPSAPPPTHPSCSNLTLGSAWAGVGTHCGLGSSASVLSSESVSTLGEEAPAPVPAVTTPEAPAPVPAPNTPAEPALAPEVTETAPATSPVPAANETDPEPEPAQQAPQQQAIAPAPKVVAPYVQHVPAAGNAAQETVVTTQEEPARETAEKTEVAEVEAKEEAKPEPEPEPTTTPSPEPSSPATASPSASASPLPSAPAEDKEIVIAQAASAEPSNNGWLIGGGSALVLVSVPLIWFSIRNLRKQ